MSVTKEPLSQAWLEMRIIHPMQMKGLLEMSRVVYVVAGALLREDGTVLMQQRPIQKMHGGLWEFPGGKIEEGELPHLALCRELEEELGIIVDPGNLTECGFAHDFHFNVNGHATCIFLYIIRAWQGSEEAREQQVVSWVHKDALNGLDMPPLDYPLTKMLISAI